MKFVLKCGFCGGVDCLVFVVWWFVVVGVWFVFEVVWMWVVCVWWWVIGGVVVFVVLFVDV